SSSWLPKLTTRQVSFLAILVSGHALDGAFVHALGPDVEPVLLKFFVGHICGLDPLFVLLPFFHPTPKCRIPIKRLPR
ncbi:MAG: hypothetical protein QOE96_2502, partial [Blastocatellia bacterium]|nr:hypothetical protein [Blastocatellia bacterium]